MCLEKSGIFHNPWHIQVHANGAHVQLLAVLQLGTIKHQTGVPFTVD
jgi:hypothetical protein